MNRLSILFIKQRTSNWPCALPPYPPSTPVLVLKFQVPVRDLRSTVLHQFAAVKIFTISHKVYLNTVEDLILQLFLE
jgi:hypothetical protein